MEYNIQLKCEYSELFGKGWYLEVLDENFEFVGWVEPIDSSQDTRDVNDYKYWSLNKDALQEELNKTDFRQALERVLTLSDVDGVSMVEKVYYPSQVFKWVKLSESEKLEVINWFKSGSRMPLYFHHLTSLHVIGGELV